MDGPAAILPCAVTANFDGDELEVGAIPVDARLPFPPLESASGASFGGVLFEVGTSEGDGPGEQIDGAIDDSSDGGDGDGE